MTAAAAEWPCLMLWELLVVVRALLLFFCVGPQVGGELSTVGGLNESPLAGETGSTDCAES